MPRSMNDVFPFNQSVVTDILTCKIIMLHAIPEFNVDKSPNIGDDNDAEASLIKLSSNFCEIARLY